MPDTLDFNLFIISPKIHTTYSTSTFRHVWGRKLQMTLFEVGVEYTKIK